MLVIKEKYVFGEQISGVLNQKATNMPRFSMCIKAKSILYAKLVDVY